MASDETWDGSAHLPNVALARMAELQGCGAPASLAGYHDNTSGRCYVALNISNLLTLLDHSINTIDFFRQ